MNREDKNVKKFAKRMLNNARGRARDPQKSRGLQEFNLDYDWVIEQMEASDYKCPYTGQPYFFGVGKKWHGRAGPAGRPSINRLNPLVGYVQENCEVVSNYYNTQLGPWTHHETRKFAFGLAWFHFKKMIGLVK